MRDIRLILYVQVLRTNEMSSSTSTCLLTVAMLSGVVRALPAVNPSTSKGAIEGIPLIVIIVMSTVIIILMMYVGFDIHSRYNRSRTHKTSILTTKPKIMKPTSSTVEATTATEDNQPSCVIDVQRETSKAEEMLRFVLRHPKIDLEQFIRVGRVDLVRIIFEETYPSLEQYHDSLHQACLYNQRPIVTLISGYLNIDDVALDIELDQLIRSVDLLPELEIEETFKMIEHLVRVILHRKKVLATSPLNKGLLSWSVKHSDYRIVQHLEQLELDLDTVA